MATPNMTALTVVSLCPFILMILPGSGQSENFSRNRIGSEPSFTLGVGSEHYIISPIEPLYYIIHITSFISSLY